ncbi:MAG: AMP-binding protein [Psychrobium sp.]|nr:AMP-binding protein [Psychrobium sp.]
MTQKLDATIIQTKLDMENINVDSLLTENLPSSIYQAIQKSAQCYQDKIAMEYILDGDCCDPKRIPWQKKAINLAIKIFTGKSYAQPYRTISFNQLLSSVTQLSNGLRDLGVNKGDVVSILLPNFPEMYVSLWGSGTAGIANPINPMLESSIIKEIMINANSNVLIALGPVPGSDIWKKVLEIKDQIPNLKTVISLFGDDTTADYSGEVPVYSYHKFVAKQHREQLNFTPPQQQDICAYFHTGGTTGQPKLAKHLHLNQLTNAEQVNLISPITQADVTLIGLPIFHVNSAIATGLAGMMNGSRLFIASPAGYRGKNIINNLLDIINNYNIAFMAGVPTVYAGLLAAIEQQTKPFVKPTKLQLAICGAAPLSSDLQKKFIEKIGVPLVEGYGSTEGSAVSTLMPINSIASKQSVGLVLPNLSLKIIEITADGDFIRQCHEDEVGEIVIAGNNVFAGYIEPTHNHQLWVTDDTGLKLIRTGDLGSLDNNGYLSLAGRKKELIIRGGHNIDPKMIEDIATQHPDVYLAAAVARPCSYSGELPVLYVTIKEQSTLSDEQMMEYVKTHIPERAATPKAVMIIKQMPVTAIGKIFKPTLACMEVKWVITQELSTLNNIGQYHINVLPDKKHSILAIISFNSEQPEQMALTNNIKELLANYAIHYRVEFKAALDNNHKVAS